MLLVFSSFRYFLCLSYSCSLAAPCPSHVFCCSPKLATSCSGVLDFLTQFVVYHRHFLSITKLNCSHIIRHRSGISQVYIKYIPGIYKLYLRYPKYISGICLVYLRYVLGRAQKKSLDICPNCRQVGYF